MAHIAFYISSHGYGHASRCLPIIQELLDQDSKLVITVKTSGVLVQYMSGCFMNDRSRINFVPLITDVGLILKPGTMDVDTQTLLREVKQFILSWDKLIQQEKAWLRRNDIKLIITDIVPWVLNSAADAGVGSILITNFTWVEIYKELLSENVWEEYLKCYQKADAVFLYPFSGEIKDNFRHTEEIGLVSRRFNEENVQKIKAKYGEALVYVSVGQSVALGQDIVVEGLPYFFLYTKGISLKGRNSQMLPVNTQNTHDYIKAADYVISKAGWGTVAEAVCARKPMIILKRDEIIEDRVTTQKLKELGLAAPIRISELNTQDFKAHLKRLESFKDNYKMLSPRYKNDAANIAQKIRAWLP